MFPRRGRGRDERRVAPRGPPGPRRPPTSRAAITTPPCTWHRGRGRRPVRWFQTYRRWRFYLARGGRDVKLDSAATRLHGARGLTARARVVLTAKRGGNVLVTSRPVPGSATAGRRGRRSPLRPRPGKITASTRSRAQPTGRRRRPATGTAATRCLSAGRSERPSARPRRRAPENGHRREYRCAAGSCGGRGRPTQPPQEARMPRTGSRGAAQGRADVDGDGDGAAGCGGGPRGGRRHDGAGRGRRDPDRGHRRDRRSDRQRWRHRHGRGRLEHQRRGRARRVLPGHGRRHARTGASAAAARGASRSTSGKARTSSSTS